jgi:hypothetical protein
MDNHTDDYGGNFEGVDWGSYFHCLSDAELRGLAAWLAAECLEVWEFKDVVDRVYAQVADSWRGRSAAFVASHGRPILLGYARRRRHFAELMAALDEARQRGALPGDVALEELQPLPAPSSKRRSVEELLDVLERTRRDEG